MTIFEESRLISAVDVARHLGITITQRGTRFWALCPFHGEKTPSLLFYTDGRWHCFGCGRNGDAVDFYASLKNVPLRMAAEALVNVFKPDTTQTQVAVTPNLLPAKRLMQIVDSWLNAEWNKASDTKVRAMRLVNLENEARDRILAAGKDYKSGHLFDMLIDQIAKADIRLEMLDFEDPYRMMKLMLEEQKQDG